MTEAFAAVIEYAEHLGVVNANRLPGAWTQRVDDRWHIAFNAHDFPVEAKPEGCMECTIAPYNCAIWYNGWLTGTMTPFEGHIGFATGATEDQFIAAVRKAGEEPLPTIDQMAGSDPDFTGEETTAEYLREIGRTGEEPR